MGNKNIRNLLWNLILNDKNQKEKIAFMPVNWPHGFKVCKFSYNQDLINNSIKILEINLGK